MSRITATKKDTEDLINRVKKRYQVKCQNLNNIHGMINHLSLDTSHVCEYNDNDALKKIEEVIIMNNKIVRRINNPTHSIYIMSFNKDLFSHILKNNNFSEINKENAGMTWSYHNLENDKNYEKVFNNVNKEFDEVINMNIRSNFSTFPSSLSSTKVISVFVVGLEKDNENYPKVKSILNTLVSINDNRRLKYRAIIDANIITK